jgi:hypothetical protein
MRETGKAYQSQTATSEAPEGIYWMDINSDAHWQVRIYQAKTSNTSMNLSVDNIIFDTGSSLCYLPPKEYKSFIAEVNKVKDCEFSSREELYFCQCNSVKDSDFPIIAMLLGSST